MTFQMQRAAGFIASVASAAILSSVFTLNASAGVIAPDLTFTLQVNNYAPIYFFPLGEQTGATSWHWEGSYNDAGWSMPSFSIDADEDPMINAQMGLQNNTLVTNLYTITVALPVAAIPGSSLIGGSVGGSLTDANQNGNAVLTYGNGGPFSALFIGMIDNIGVLGLHPGGGSVAAAFGGETVNVPAISSGLPGPTGAGPAVAASIGIQLQFLLTPGDSVALSSFFVVEPVPAPAGLALLGLAGLGGRARRRA